MPTRNQRKELEALAAKPDGEIGQSDIPEITDELSVGALRGVFARSATRHISTCGSPINLPPPRGFPIRHTVRVCCMNRL